MRRLLCLLLSLVMVFALVGTSTAAPAIRVRVDNAELQFDAQPFTENDRTLVPVRALAEKLGFTVGWDEAEQKVTLTRGDTTILLWVGSNRVVVNGKEGTIDVPAKKVNDRTFIPVRFVAEQLGASVQWDGTEQTVRVTTGEELIRQLNQQQAGQLNRRQTGDFVITMTMNDPQKPGSSMTFQMPMSMDVQTYQNDVLSLVTIDMPAVLGLGELKTGTAVKDGQIYSLNPLTKQWTQSGTADTGAALEQLRQSQQGGLASLTQVQETAMKAMSVRIAGQEMLNGVPALRVDVDLSKVNYTELFAKAFGSLLPSAPAKFDIQRFAVSYWLDPATLFVYKTTLDMSMVVNVTQAGQTVALKMDMTGALTGEPLSAPIEFPDLTGGQPFAAYWEWINTAADPSPCFDAIDTADAHWDDADYVQGKADAATAAQCFTDLKATWTEVTPPTAFANAHSKLILSFDGLAKAYVTYEQAFDLAAKGDLAAADAKRTEADEMVTAAQEPFGEGVDDIMRLQEQYGLD